MAAHTLSTERLPRHVAIIMDGNGRWARRRALSRIMGHRKGMESVKETVRVCREIGIEVLTLYAFSSENWKRPRREVRSLMSLLKRYIRSEVKDLNKNDIKLQAIGSIDLLPDDVKDILSYAIESTKQNSSMILNVALSYGARDEILHAVKRIACMAAEGTVQPEDIDEPFFSQHLYTEKLPDPDLLIRTSGEFRVSNFLLWQLAYTEIYVTDVLWPDFRKKDIYAALADYQKRKRRFGLTDEQIETSQKKSSSKK